MSSQESPLLFAANIPKIYFSLKEVIDKQADDVRDTSITILDGQWWYQLEADSDIVRLVMFTFSAEHSIGEGERMSAHAVLNLASRLNPSEYAPALREKLQTQLAEKQVLYGQGSDGEHTITVGSGETDQIIISLGYNEGEDPPEIMLNRAQLEQGIAESIERKAVRELLTDEEKQQLYKKALLFFDKMVTARLDEPPVAQPRISSVVIKPESERAEQAIFVNNTALVLLCSSVVFYFFHEYYQHEVRQQPVVIKKLQGL